MSLKRLPSKFWHGWRTLPDSSPQRWFVVVALVFGALFAVLSPAYDVPDEFSHTSRAWQIAHGQLTAQKSADGQHTGGHVPKSFRELGEAVRGPDFSLAKLPQLGSIPLDAADTTYHSAPNLAVYSPLVYVPQAIGLGIGDLFELPVFYTLLLGRLFNVVAYVLLLYWAIRLLPFGKWAGVIIGLLPMHILLAGSLNADPVSIGIGALVISVVLWLRDRATLLDRQQYLWLMGLAAALALAKLPFPLLLGLFVFLPIRVLGGTAKRRWLMLGGIALAALIVGGGWLLLAKQTMVPYGPPGVDAAGQVASMTQHPTGFFKAFLNTYITPVSDSFIQNYVIGVGPVLAWLPLWATYFYTAFLVASFYGIRTTSKATFSRAQKQLTAALGIVIFIVISLLLYVSWTPVALPIIEGMQSRYFTPFLLLLIPLVAVRSPRVKEGLLKTAWYRYVPLVFLLAGVIAAFFYYYDLKIMVPF